ncbi:hypothetical protein F4779DRAFT_450955 [Xylariaceae sp. FL0662B]|nr:hypothetical protein F4779DRAFT_450955 [Xylariaceae sp. FL0662B]
MVMSNKAAELQPKRALRSKSKTGGQLIRPTRNVAAKRRLQDEDDLEEPKAATRRRAKKPLPSYFQRSAADESLDPNQHIRLFALPREVIREIASKLHPESAVCLTLTCKLALHILGCSCWTDESVQKRWNRNPETNIEHRPLLLELLYRDIQTPGYELCPRCCTLHPPLKRPSEHPRTPMTKYCWGQDAVIDYLPRSEDGRGYSLVFAHIKSVLSSTSPDSGSPIEYLSGSFEVPHHRLHYTVSTSARWTNGNLILQHDYTFRPFSPKTPLKATDVLDLPFRICPHQSTTTERPPHNRYTPDKRPNGPLLTHSIVAVLPVSQQTGVAKPAAFRKPTSSEQLMMSSADRGEEVTYRCRGCPTKWQVDYGLADGVRRELRIRVFHCFYKELHMAARVWPWFVRREGELLGKDKRNSEFWSQGRTYVDFRIE